MRVTVAVASRHGATTQIALRVAEVLRVRGHDVRVAPAADLSTVADADAVVLGSAVYYGSWLADALALVERCEPELRSRPVWLFSSGPTGEPGTRKPSTGTDVGTTLARTGARSHREFGGRLDRHDLGVGQRLLLGAMRAPVGDFRDWDEIERWTNGIADELAAIARPAAAVSASPVR